MMIDDEYKCENGGSSAIGYTTTKATTMQDYA